MTAQERPSSSRRTSSASQTSEPALSFLTTAYRTEDSVRRTIESVLAQTSSDWELVVVDNGNSAEMLTAVAPYLTDPQVRLVRQENNGPAGGVMAAADHAQGRYFVVLNSDDLIVPDFASRMLDFLRSNPHVAAVTCDATLFTDPGMRPTGSTYLRRAGLRRPPDPSNRLTVADVVAGACPYYTGPIRRDVWESVGGMSDVGGAATRINDLDFWLRALAAGNDIRMLPDRLCYYQVDNSSVSRPVSGAASEELEAQIQGSFGRAAVRADNERDRRALRAALTRLHYWQAVRRARLALDAGRPAEAAAFCAAALRQRRTTRSVGGYLLLRTVPGAVPRLRRAKHRILGERSRFGQRRPIGWLTRRFP